VNQVNAVDLCGAGTTCRHAARFGLGSPPTRPPAAPIYPSTMLPCPAPSTVYCMQVELRGQDLPWQRFLDGAPPPPPAAALPAHVADAEEITNIIFSSGTTGQPPLGCGVLLCRLCSRFAANNSASTRVCALHSYQGVYANFKPDNTKQWCACPPARLSAGEPKAIPWTHITPMRAGVDAFFHQDVRQGDVLCWPTNMGWMMGPWLVYAGKHLASVLYALPASCQPSLQPASAACNVLPPMGQHTWQQLNPVGCSPAGHPPTYLPEPLPACSPAEWCHHCALPGQPAGETLWAVCAARPRHSAGSGAQHSQDLAGQRLHGGPGLELSSLLQVRN
jgi:hypothetical protein